VPGEAQHHARLASSNFGVEIVFSHRTFSDLFVSMPFFVGLNLDL